MHNVNLATVVIITIFSFCYLFITAWQTAKQKLDIYDLFMLSMVAVIPLAFVLFPELTFSLTRMMGVTFPFVLMFGILLVTLFANIHRFSTKIHLLEKDNRLLIQEVSLLKARIDSKKIPIHEGSPTPDKSP